MSAVSCGRCRRGVRHLGGTSHVPCDCPAGDRFRIPAFPKTSSVVTAVLTILLALLLLAPSVQARPNPDDAVIRMPDGVVIQAEYRAFYLRHRNDPRLFVIPDDRSVILRLRPGVIMGPDYTVRVIRRHR